MSIDTEMKFEELRDAIETLLTSFQTGRFQTVGEQRQSIGAEESKGILRIVEIFYSDGDYSDSRSSRQKSAHDVTYQIYYTVTEPAQADLAVLKDANATPAATAAALAGVQSGARKADRSMDTLRRMVSQIILDPVNHQLGLALDGNKNQVANPRLSNFRKDAPINQGGLVTLTASEQLTARVEETFAGATPVVPVEPAIDIEAEFSTPTDADDANPSKFGVEVTTT